MYNMIIFYNFYSDRLVRRTPKRFKNKFCYNSPNVKNHSRQFEINVKELLKFIEALKAEFDNLN